MSHSVANRYGLRAGCKLLTSFRHSLVLLSRRSGRSKSRCWRLCLRLLGMTMSQVWCGTMLMLLTSLGLRLLREASRYTDAGGPLLGGVVASIARGQVRVRSRVLGGRARSVPSEFLDGCIVCPSSSRKSVVDVLSRKRRTGYSGARWAALLAKCEAVGWRTSGS